MLDREERELLVVPYTPPPAPRAHLVTAAIVALGAVIAGFVLLVADYSSDVTAALILSSGGGLIVAAGLVIAGIRARRRFRDEMERAVDVTPAALARDDARQVG